MKIIAQCISESWSYSFATFAFKIFGVNVHLTTNFENPAYAYCYKRNANSELELHRIKLDHYAEDGMECWRNNRNQITEWLYELFWPEIG